MGDWILTWRLHTYGAAWTRTVVRGCFFDVACRFFTTSRTAVIHDNHCNDRIKLFWIFACFNRQRLRNSCVNLRKLSEIHWQCASDITSSFGAGENIFLEVILSRNFIIFRGQSSNRFVFTYPLVLSEANFLHFCEAMACFCFNFMHVSKEGEKHQAICLWISSCQNITQRHSYKIWIFGTSCFPRLALRWARNSRN